jgi:hypothetical protein
MGYASQRDGLFPRRKARARTIQAATRLPLPPLLRLCPATAVACCDYVKAGDQTQGAIKTAGAIDVEAVRKEISLVTEGGEQAFRLRKAKYGF